MDATGGSRIVEPAPGEGEGDVIAPVTSGSTHDCIRLGVQPGVLLLCGGSHAALAA